jgi:hypothetical protein
VFACPEESLARTYPPPIFIPAIGDYIYLYVEGKMQSRKPMIFLLTKTSWGRIRLGMNKQASKMGKAAGLLGSFGTNFEDNGKGFPIFLHLF